MKIMLITSLFSVHVILPIGKNVSLISNFTDKIYFEMASLYTARHKLTNVSKLCNISNKNILLLFSIHIAAGASTIQRQRVEFVWQGAGTSSRSSGHRARTL